MTEIRKFAYSEFLSSGNWIPVNKLILKKFGLPDALMVGFLFERLNYWRGINQLEEIDGQEYFYCRISDIETELGFTNKTQARIIDKLVEKGIVETKKKGVPPKRYFRINEDVLEDFLFNTPERENQLCPKGKIELGETPKLNREKLLNQIRRNSQIELGETPKSPCITEITSTNISSTEITDTDISLPTLAKQGTLSTKMAKLKPPKIAFADYVSMTKEEHQKLINEFGEENTKEIIEILNNYKGANGKTYKSDYLAILNWVVKRWKDEHRESKSVAKSFKQQEHDDFMAYVEEMAQKGKYVP